jgi:putative ABC transport system substrate-binding protein
VKRFIAAGLERAYTGGSMRRTAARFGRRRFLRGGLALAGLGLAVGCGVPPPRAQPPKVHRIGLLWSELEPAEAEAFRAGLGEHGYVEGEQVAIEPRLAGEQLERYPELAAELVRLPCDVIVTAGTTATRAAKQATDAIPIVMALSSDPVRAGFAASLAHPGGNVTGLTDLAAELSPKRLQLLQGVVPGLSHVAVLWSATGTPTMTEAAGQPLGVRVERFEVRGAEDLDEALAAVAASRPGALFIERNAIFRAPRAQIAEFAVRQRLPTMWGAPGYVESGGLMGYGVNYPDSFRRAAGYVAKILQGTKPGDLPIERPTKFDLVINLKTAQAIGLAIAPPVLQEATEIIQ